MSTVPTGFLPNVMPEGMNANQYFGTGSSILPQILEQLLSGSSVSQNAQDTTGQQQSNTTGNQTTSGTTSQTGDTSRTLPAQAEEGLNLLSGILPELGLEQGQQSGNTLQSAINADESQLQSPGFQAPTVSAAPLVQAAVAPVTGSANAARDQATEAAAARGGYAPGLNATLENIQQTEGQQTAQAALNAQNTAASENQQAQLAADQAAQQQQEQAAQQLQGAASLQQSGQQGLLGDYLSMLLGYPEYSTTNTGNTTNQQGTQTQSATNTNSAQQVQGSSAQANTGAGVQTTAPQGTQLTLPTVAQPQVPSSFAATPAAKATTTSF